MRRAVAAQVRAAAAFRRTVQRAPRGARQWHPCGVTHDSDFGTAKAVLLDIGGVVLKPATLILDELAATEPRLAAVLPPGGLGRSGDELWQQMLARQVSEREYWQIRGEQIGVALGLGAGTRPLMELLYDNPAHRAAAAQIAYLRPEVVALMHEVRAAGIPLGALTNDLVAFHGQAWVDLVVDASLTGVLKPDPRAYASGAEAIGFAPAEIVYLDDMPWNVEGGLAAGLGAVRVGHDDPSEAVATARRRLGLTPPPP